MLKHPLILTFIDRPNLNGHYDQFRYSIFAMMTASQNIGCSVH